MFRGGVQRDRIFNLSTNHFLQFEAKQNAVNGDMLFQVGSGTGTVPIEKLRDTLRTDDLIKEPEITQRGNGSIRVDSSELTNGIYTYALRVDAQAVNTRKMLRSR